MWWRLANGASAALIVAAILLPLGQHWQELKDYQLSAAALKLVGNTDPSLARQLTYDVKKQQYVFNQDAIATGADAGLPKKLQQASVGAVNEANTKSYSLEVPERFEKGVTYHDTNSQLSFTMLPQFEALYGKAQSGHLVFPLSGNSQAVYTLKNNGLKEDIIVQKVMSDSLEFNYHLQLPDSLAVKPVPNGDGAIGIYSGDPALFGEIQYGSDADRTRVERSRVKAEKTYLVFGLPAPVVKDTDGKTIGSARFELAGTTLKVVASGLTAAKGPISIDPSVVVTSTSDFQTNSNNEGMVDFSTSGQISRGNLTGGNLGNGGSASWTTATNTFTTGRDSGQSFAYNGYLYTMGGSDATLKYKDIQCSPINASTGDLGTWITSSKVMAGSTTGRQNFAATIYNGYVFFSGGNTTANTTDVYSAPLTGASDCVGPWSAALPAFTNGRQKHAMVAYGGYLYITGGINSGTYYSDVQYAAINADGTIGSWNATASFTNGRYGHGAVAYNGYMYIIGGRLSGSYANDVQYAKINSDGTLGTFIATSSFSVARYGMLYGVYNGYLYIAAGTRTGATVVNDAQYAPINANGSVGTWLTTSSSITNARQQASQAVYNGYVYILGGSDSPTTPTVYYGDTQYAKIDAPGTTGVFTSSTAFTTTRSGAQTVAYKGMLYVLGGDNGGIPASTISAATINSDGTLGSFTSTGMTSFVAGNGGPGPLNVFAAFAYNNNMYIVGGCNVGWGACNSFAGVTGVYKAAISGTGTIGTWSAQTALPVGLYGLSAVVYNDTVYVLGGVSTATFQTAIYYQVMGSGGTLSGTWSTSSRTLPASNSAYAGVVTNGNYLYIVGGCSAGPVSCTTATNNVYYAKMGDGGDLVTAFTLTNTFTNARGRAAVGIVNGMLYISGGLVNTTYYTDTQFAPFKNDGTVGTWSTAGLSTLPAGGRYGVGSAVYNGVMYVTGGTDGTNYYNTTQFITPKNGGTGLVGSWTTASSFTNARNAHSSVAYNGYLYVMLGNGGSGDLTDVQYARLGDAGALATDSGCGATWCTSASAFPLAVQNASVNINNGYIYVVGGKHGTPYNNVYYAKFGTAGEFAGDAGCGSRWCATGGINTARFNHSSAVYNNYLYILGGNDGTVNLSSVEYAQITSRGALATNSGCGTAWCTTGSFTNIRQDPTSFTANGYIYVAGGVNGTTYYNDVQYAQLNANGTVGSWNKTTGFIGARSGQAMDVHNGFVYIVGGNVGGTRQADVQFAPIIASGGVGTWQLSTAFAGSGISGLQAVAVNGTLYITGGTDGTTSSSAVQYASLDSIARKGRYSKLISLTTPVKVTGISYSGILANGNDDISFRSASSSGAFGSSASSNSLSGAGLGTCIAGTQNPQYLLVTLLLDDSVGGMAAVYPDSEAALSSVQDITVSYTLLHPAPNIRLRGGQTLQSGVLSALDTCYP